MNIVLYSTDCPKCNVLKKKLNLKGISFQENNSVDEMISLGFSSVPVLQVDDLIMNFSEAVTWINKQ